MKQTVVNKGKVPLHVKYTRNGISQETIINPGRTTLPEGAEVLTTHPNLRVGNSTKQPPRPAVKQQVSGKK